MRRLLNILLALAIFSAMLCGCNRPKNIPEKDLELIFKDFFLANAYASSAGNVNPDSVDMYEPILKKHGYKMADFTYTLGSFSKRKSNRISSIIENTEKMLTAEYEVMRQAVADMDTIDAKGKRMLSRVIFEDSTISVRRVQDTGRLRLYLPVEPGAYEISYSYYIDSLDKNTNLRTTFRQQNAKGVGFTAYDRMTPYQRKRTVKRFDTEDSDSVIIIVFANYPSKGLQQPRMRIDSLKVVYEPTTAVVLDSLVRRWRTNKYDIDEFRQEGAQDSLALHTLPPRIAAAGDSIP